VTDDAAADGPPSDLTLDGLDEFAAAHTSHECSARARELLSAADEESREVGVHLFSLAALNEPELHDALDEVVVASARDASAEVRATAAHVAGEVPTRLSVDVLVGLVRDASVTVRRSVAGSLPLTTDDESPNPRVVGALLLLIADADAVVRDMAAFGLGTQMAGVDTPAVRAALRRLLDEPDGVDAYPAAEAAMGLALRGDTSVAPVLAERLRSQGTNAGRLWLDAAAVLASPELLPALEALREPDDDADDPWVQALDAAIAACAAAGGGAHAGH